MRGVSKEPHVRFVVAAIQVAAGPRSDRDAPSVIDPVVSQFPSPIRRLSVILTVDLDPYRAAEIRAEVRGFQGVIDFLNRFAEFFESIVQADCRRGKLFIGTMDFLEKRQVFLRHLKTPPGHADYCSTAITKCISIARQSFGNG